MNLSLVRPEDEAYWDQWRAAPKAFVPLELGQRLWGSRFGDVSSIRFALRDAEAVAAAVREEMSSQIVVRPVRQEALAAAAGTTDFGEYFLYFSFFLVVSALLIAYLFFALGVEQRAREVGLLAAVGFSPSACAATSSPRASWSCSLVSSAGAAGAIGYAALDHARPSHVVGRRGRHDRPPAPCGARPCSRPALSARPWRRWPPSGWAPGALARRSPRALLAGGARDVRATRRPVTPAPDW